MSSHPGYENSNLSTDPFPDPSKFGPPANHSPRRASQPRPISTVVPWCVDADANYSTINHDYNRYTVATKNVKYGTVPTDWYSLHSFSIVLATEVTLQDHHLGRFHDTLLNIRENQSFAWTGPPAPKEDIPTDNMDADAHKKREKKLQKQRDRNALLLAKRAVVLYNPRVVKIHKNSKNRLSGMLARRNSPWVADILAMPSADARWLVICVYLPTQKDRVQRKILHDLARVIPAYQAEYQVSSIILGGDFNMVLSEQDSVTPCAPSPPGVRDALTALLVDLQLVDLFRHYVPDKPHGTNRAGSNASRRLDRIYVSQHLVPNAIAYGERREPLLRSDHVTVHTNILWTLDCGLHMGRRFIADTVLYRYQRTMNNFERAKFLLWDKQVAFCVRIMKNAIYKRRHDLRVGNARQESRKPGIHKHINHHIKRTTTPAHVFMCMDKGDGPGDPKVYTTREILDVATAYWRDRTQPAPPASGIAEFLEAWPPLADNDTLGKDFTKEELYIALCDAKEGSPGEDGLPYSFWSETWRAHGPALTMVANDMMDGRIPRRMTQVLIALIPKKTGATNIKDFRPISLINTSLRIICRAISNRLLKVEGLITDSQSGHIPWSQTHHDILQFKELIRIWQDSDHSSTGDSSVVHSHVPAGTIAMGDFEKAFDLISHDYILQVLRSRNIPPRLFTAISTILTSQTACIYLNRIKGESFPISRGTMQGNPLSPFLFVLAHEPLLYRLNSKLTGFVISHKLATSAFPDDLKVPDGEVKVPDGDLKVFLAGDADASKAAAILDEFCRVSGSTVRGVKSIGATQKATAAHSV